MFKELTELGAKHYAVAISTILALIGPGLLCIYHYRPDIIYSIDAIKLVLLSAGLALPVCCVNFCVAGITSTKQRDPAIVWLSSASIAAANLYFALYIAYLKSMPFRIFTFIVLFLEMLTIMESFVELAIYRLKRSE